MAGEEVGQLDIAHIHLPMAIAFQALLAVAALRSGLRRGIRVAVATVLLANAIECVYLLALLRGVAALDQHYPVRRIDSVILLSAAYLTSQLPRPLGGARGARIAGAAWIAASVIALAALPNAEVAEWAGFVDVALHELPVYIVAFLLAFHTIPCLASERGVRDHGALFLASGIAVSLAYMVGREGAGIVFGEDWTPTHAYSIPFRGIYIAAFLILPLAAVRALRRGGLAREEGFLLSGLVMGGLAVGLLEHAVLPRGVDGFTPLAEFVSQSFRPILFGWAIAAAGAGALSVGWRRLVVAATQAMMATSVFILLLILLSRTNVNADTLDLGAAAAAVVAVAVVFLAIRRPLKALAVRWTPNDPKEIAAYLARLRAAPASSREGHQGDIPHEVKAALEGLSADYLLVPKTSARGLTVGGILESRYRIEGILGEGGQGRAWLARDIIDADEVVVKEIVRPWEEAAASRTRSITREARLAGKLVSPHLAKIHGLARDADRVFLIREYVRGEPLGAWRNARPRSVVEIVRVVSDVCSGLDVLHAAGFVHLDLKPSNVIVRDDGRAVIIDLGLARPVTQAARAAGDTLRTEGTTTPGGTHGWMAPEQALGGRVDTRTDVWAVGNLLAFLLHDPHQEASPPHALDDVIAQATSRDRARRYPTAGALAGAIAPWASG